MTRPHLPSISRVGLATCGRLPPPDATSSPRPACTGAGAVHLEDPPGVLFLIEGARRLLDRPQVQPTAVRVFGGLGLAVNVIGLLVLACGCASRINTRAAFLEVVVDAAVLVSAVVIAAIGF